MPACSAWDRPCLPGTERGGQDGRAQVRRQGPQRVAVQHLDFQARFAFQRALLLQERHLFGRLGDHQAAVLDHAKIFLQLGRQSAPGMLGMQMQRQGFGRLARAVQPMLDHAVLKLEVQAAGIASRGLAVELALSTSITSTPARAR